MDIKALLKKDFGYDVRIASGSGSQADPFVFEPCSVAEASATQYQILCGLGRGRQEIWRYVTDGIYTEGDAPLQWLEIETVAYTESDIVTERRRLCFDLSLFDKVPDPFVSTAAWRDSRTSFEAPYLLEWLHFDRAVANAPPQSPLDVSLFYSGIGAKATVFVYAVGANTESVTPGDTLRDLELKRACSQLRMAQPEAKDPWETKIVGPFATRYFLIGDDMSVVAVALSEGYFIKLRLTFNDDLKMRELMTGVVSMIAWIVEG